jgi:LTXXQ motif family protein
MRKTMIIFMSAALLTGTTALTSSAVARDRSDRTELSANQMADRADARTAKMKVDLNLTADQEKNWSGFASAMQDFSKQQGDRRIAMRDARAQQQGKFDMLDQMRKSADAQIERSNDRKKLADAAEPLYTSLNEQQKQRFAESMIFGGDRDRETD